jgi:hypothetical protein
MPPRAAPLRPAINLALDEAIRAWPSSRYWRLTRSELGRVDVYDAKTEKRVAVIFGSTNEERNS